MKEARSLWNRKVGDSSSSSASNATTTPDRNHDDESWHQRYVAEDTSTISDKSDAPSLYAGSLFSRASKADTALTSPGGSPPHGPTVDTALPHSPSPLLGRKRGASSSSNHSIEHHPHHPSKPKPTYFDPYSSAAKPSVSTTTVSTSKDGDNEVSSETRSSFDRVSPPSLRTHTSGSSSLVAVPPPSVPTTQLHVEPAPSLPSSQTSSTAAVGSTTPATRTNSSFSSPSQDDRSPSSGPPVRTQLSRSTMMRVPAIPKDRKAEQMSFGSTPPEEVENALDQHPSRTTRLGSSIYQLVSGAGSKIQGISPSELPSTFHDDSIPSAAATPIEDPMVVETSASSSHFDSTSTSTSNQPPPLPSRPRTSARDIPSSPSSSAPTSQDRPTAISNTSSSTSSSTSTSPSATESLLSIVKLDRDRGTTPTPQSSGSVPSVTPVSSSFANTKTSEGFLVPSSQQQQQLHRPPTLPPRKSFIVEVPLKPTSSPSVPLSTDHSSNVLAHALAKGPPPLPPRTPSSVNITAAAAGEGSEKGEREEEVVVMVKPAMTRSRSDSEERSQEGLFPLEG